MSKLWGGRFRGHTEQLVHRYNQSISFDQRLYNEDITGSVAWARGLARVGILTHDEAQTLIDGLEQVRQEFANGRFLIQPNDEDIHTAIERRLIEKIGTVGGKLHTGRSRNDQVATDLRLWTMHACDSLHDTVRDLQQAIIHSAEPNLNLPMPGYTHLQHAQPITWGHWLLSHFWPLQRDQQRLTAVRAAAAVLPLGAAALAGSAFPIDRHFLAQELGFTAVSPNSLDAVASRDFAADFLYASTMIGLHLSRLSEQLILFNSSEFSFITLDDGYSTGSSIMPQKKNPDTLELTRGKSGRLLGNLTGFLATLKGLPSTYDKDLQEDKEPLFDAFDTLTMALPVMSGLLRTLTLRPDKMAAQLNPALLATELADYLAKRGVPFREAHGVVGAAVRLAEEKGLNLTQLTLTDLQQLSPQFEADAAHVLSVAQALAQRNVPGGTGPQALANQLAAAKTAVS